jgi:hypothetical protein
MWGKSIGRVVEKTTYHDFTSPRPIARIPVEKVSMTREETRMEASEEQVILLGFFKDSSHRTGGKRWLRYLPHAPPARTLG